MASVSSEIDASRGVSSHTQRHVFWKDINLRLDLLLSCTEVSWSDRSLSIHFNGISLAGT